jgi:ABC-type dipeptide/oligopeptide/nickel transport system permease component
MLSYIARRSVSTIIVVFIVTVLIFSMMQMIPGDPALILLGEFATPESVLALREELGLDLPLIIQYWRFISRAVRGDFGRSIRTRQPIIDEIKVVFPATVELAFVALLFTVILGIGAGVLSAVKRGTLLDGIVRIVSLAGIGMPVFWLGLMLVLVFSFRLGLMPASSRLSVFTSIPRITGFYLLDSLLVRDFKAFCDAFKHVLLPAITLSITSTATIERMTSSSVLDALKQDYVVTARAKGLPEHVVLGKHVLRNSLIPVVTVLGLQIGSMLGGAALTETIFAWPGMGRMMVTAIQGRDMPVVQSCVLIIAVLFSFINLGVDILYGILNPRIRIQGG